MWLYNHVILENMWGGGYIHINEVTRWPLNSSLLAEEHLDDSPAEAGIGTFTSSTLKNSSCVSEDTLISVGTLALHVKSRHACNLLLSYIWILLVAFKHALTIYKNSRKSWGFNSTSAAHLPFLLS